MIHEEAEVAMDEINANTTANKKNMQNKPKWLTSNCHRVTFFWVTISWQVLMLILYAIFADYAHIGKAKTGSSQAELDVDHFYPVYQDVHVMIFIGFGFLMTFLHKYGFSAVGYNFLLGAFAIQWSILINGFMDGLWNNFKGECTPLGDTLIERNADDTRFCVELNLESLIVGDFSAAAVLITYGAVLGKTNPTQMIIVAILEIIFFAFNENVGVIDFQAVDMGGSVFVHTFGAYFGLALSWVISSSKNGEKGMTGKVVDREDNSSSVTSDLFSMLGTIFLWMFWPSFNGALASGDQQYRVMINTVLSLSACCVAAFLVDNLVRPNHKFDMVSIQNATLAGGVAVGSSADLVIHPWGAILIGMFAGALSVLGYRYVQPSLARIGLDDTCGVHNLHGMPGILGGVGAAIAVAVAGDSVYGESVGAVFPARAGENGRTAGEQARYQVAALCVTLVISIGGGIVTGIIIKIPCLQFTGKLKDGDEAKSYDFCNFCHSGDERTWYDDSYYWGVPDEEEGGDTTSS